MKNKKLIFSIILTTVLVSCSTNNVKALSDTRGLQLSDTQIANNGEHTHTYSTDWSADDLYHWHDSTCEHNLISDKENHSFGDWYTVLNPTEYKVGKEQRECNKCHYIEEKDIPVLEHVHEYSEEWSYDETHHWHESTCGISEKQNYEAHEFGDWVVKKEPRDEIEGLKTRKCNKCDYFESETIEALPHTHSYSDSWTYNETHHWHNSTCFDDTISEYKEHTFDVWIVDVEPTKTSIGEEHSSCYCGYVQSCYIYSINYILNGGANNPLNPEKFSRNSVELTLYSPTKNGYDFIGWKYNEDYVFEIDIELTCNITLEAIWTTHAYSINYETFGGINNPSNPNAYSIESENIMLESPTKTGYDFLGWYDTSSFSNKISSINQGSSGDITLFARWSPTVYSIEYNLNDGVNSTLNPIDYTIESNIIFDKATKTGYTFIGWFDDDGNQINSISPGQTGNITLTAYWNDGDTFTVTLNPDGGSVSQTTISVQYNHNYSLPESTRLGYTFDGWYDGSTKVNSTGTWIYTSNKTFVAHWTVIKYSINYELNGGTNNSSNPRSYTVEDSVTFVSPKKTGYTFTGWFINNESITGISVGSTGTINVEARWSANLNNLSVTSEDTSKGTVAIKSGSGYSDESITVVATPVDGCVFKGWYNESTKVSDDFTYTFSMPTNDYSLVAHFLTKSEEWNANHGVIPVLSSDGKSITYGLYPQKNVDDPTLVSALNSLITPESNGWYRYEDDYYARISANPYNSSYEFDNGTLISKGTTYWFKCEPIVWNVLSNSDGEYYILSSVLLDAHCYSKKSIRTIDGKTVYENNYKYSDIREWLNADFYNIAFALGNSNIKTTTVKNDPSTTHRYQDTFTCENTEDKVFLPCYRDYADTWPYNYGLANNESRICKVTDYARARGAKYSTNSSYMYNGYYWTRSPADYDYYNNNSRDAWFIRHDGSLSYSEISGVSSSEYGVRPALTLKLS